MTAIELTRHAQEGFANLSRVPVNAAIGLAKREDGWVLSLQASLMYLLSLFILTGFDSISLTRRIILTPMRSHSSRRSCAAHMPKVFYGKGRIEI
jgi:hypothetical protein